MHLKFVFARFYWSGKPLVAYGNSRFTRPVKTRVHSRTLSGIVYLFITSDKGGGTCFCPCLFVCLSVCLLARLLENACLDLDEMLPVDRCRDMDELINF